MKNNVLIWPVSFLRRMDRYTLLKLFLASWIFVWASFWVVWVGEGWHMEGAFIESRVLAILVTCCCCLIALQVWFDSIPRWRGEAQSPSGRLFSTPLHLVLRNLMPVSSPKTKLAIANAALYLSGIGIAYFFIVGGNQRGTDDFILPCCTSFLLFIILLSYVTEKNRLMNIVEPTGTYTLLTGIGVLGLVTSLFLLWFADSDNPDPWIGFYCFSSMILIIIPFLALSRPSSPKVQLVDEKEKNSKRDNLTDEEKRAMLKTMANVFGSDNDVDSDTLSKNCEHCGFLNSAETSPYWASLASPSMAFMLEGTAGCDVSCVNCGKNFWVSTKELTGSGSDAQFDSMPGIGDYIVNKMNKNAEESGASTRYELPTERAERKNRKKTSKSEK